MVKPKAILFDLDGTLLDNSQYVVDAYAQGAKKLGHDIDRNLIHDQAGKSTFETAKAMGIPEKHWREIDISFWSYFGELVEDDSKPIVMMPGVMKLLDQVARSGIKMGVITSNREDYARKMLKRTLLLEYFEIVVGKETVKQVKPSPEPIIFALQKLEIVVNSYYEVWFVGDSPSDMEAAHAANIRAIGINADESRLMSHVPHMLFTSLYHLEKYLHLDITQPRKITLLIDFDGTITTKDVAEEILIKYAKGDWKEVENQAAQGNISLEECLIQQYSMLEGNLGEWIAWGHSIDVRSGFDLFLKKMYELGLEVVCVSAGLSFVIADFIRKHGWILSVISPLTTIDEGKVEILPVPFDDQYEDFKVHQVRRRQELGHQVIYVGDGGSDVNGILHADYRFSVKGSFLSAYLADNNTDYTEFTTFEGLGDEIQDLIYSKTS